MSLINGPILYALHMWACFSKCPGFSKHSRYAQISLVWLSWLLYCYRYTCIAQGNRPSDTNNFYFHSLKFITLLIKIFHKNATESVRFYLISVIILFLMYYCGSIRIRQEKNHHALRIAAFFDFIFGCIIKFSIATSRAQNIIHIHLHELRGTNIHNNNNTDIAEYRRIFEFQLLPYRRICLHENL